MSITLTNPVTKGDIDGTTTTITNVRVGNTKFDSDGNVQVLYIDSSTSEPVKLIHFKTLAAVSNIIGQIDSYVTSNGIIAGTKD